jgi:hypothetical protein
MKFVVFGGVIDGYAASVYCFGVLRCCQQFSFTHGNWFAKYKTKKPV